MDINKEFDENFVEYLGEKVEPIFKDPNGSVGPIKQFINDKIKQITDEIRQEIVYYAGIDVKATKHLIKTLEEIRDNYIK